MPSRDSSIPHPLHLLQRRSFALAVLFVLAHVLTYRLTFIHPLQGLNITPWNPPAALSIMLLVWRPRWWWLSWLTLLVSDASVRGNAWPGTNDIVAAAVLVASHAAIARILLRRFGRPPDVRTLRELLVLVAIVVVGGLANAIAYVGTLVLAHAPEVAATPLDALGRYWIGDAVGLLVTLPLLFIVAHPQRRATAADMLTTLPWWLAVGLAIVVCGVVFSGLVDDPFKYFYLFFLPTVWAAARFGLCGATGVATVVQLLLMGALQLTDVGDATVFEFQMLMAALAGTGLLLGAAVDEREAAANSLAASLRLAAAGDTAAAIAHELAQPLAALRTYARATQWLLQGTPAAPPEGRAALEQAVDRTVAEAQRAGEIVQRLRAFLEDRAMQLSATDLSALVRTVAASREKRAAAAGVTVETRIAGTLPDVWLDPVQMEVVLRNLLDNAIEAAAAAAAPRWVRIEAEPATDEVRVRVLDSGPGVPAHRLPDLFAPHRSDKPAGMGIGLSLARAIVEAHEGTLNAAAGPGGAFFMSLPVGRDAADA
jgi:signal transduction histidine kinase